MNQILQNLSSGRTVLIGVPAPNGARPPLGSETEATRILLAEGRRRSAQRVLFSTARLVVPDPGVDDTRELVEEIFRLRIP